MTFLNKTESGTVEFTDVRIRHFQRLICSCVLRNSFNGVQCGLRRIFGLNALQWQKNMPENKLKISHVNERTNTIETKQACLHFLKGGGTTKLSFISKCFPQSLPTVIAVLHLSFPQRENRASYYKGCKTKKFIAHRGSEIKHIQNIKFCG